MRSELLSSKTSLGYTQEKLLSMTSVMFLFSQQNVLLSDCFTALLRSLVAFMHF
jgi:hypothetical protein